MGIAAVGAVAVGASVYSSSKNAKAAKSAAKTQADASNNAAGVQSQASQDAIAEQRRQFDQMVSLLSPYAKAGTGALKGQQDILGLNGAGSQKSAIESIQNSPYFQATAKQGENAILQNASATGGLRGGNTQGALAQFRPQLLNQLVQQQYQNLGGITNLGQSAAAGQAAGGMQSANSIGNLLSQGGQAQANGLIGAGQANAGGIIGKQQSQNQLIGNLLQIGGAAYGAGAF